MAKVTVALKPKYATRRAVDKVIFNEGNFLTVIPEESSRHILSQFDTCHVALVSEGKYYPVTVDNYKEQYDLLVAGSPLTVEEDEKFGIKKIEYFFGESESEAKDYIQHNAYFENGIFDGTLYKVINSAEGPDPEHITKDGYWAVFKFDKAAADAEGYSELKFFGSDEEIVDGDNFIFVGATEEDVYKKIINVYGKLTVDEETGDVEQTFINLFSTKILNEADAINAIEIDGVAYDTLDDAFVSLKGKGGKITVNKSITTDAVVIDLSDGKDYILELMNGVTVSLGKYIKVSDGCSLSLKGEGTIQEVTPYFAPIIPINLNEAKSVTVWIGKGITLKGWAGIMVDKASYNVDIYCYGNCIGMNDGYADGTGVYVNGNVKSGSVTFSGSTEGTVGNGMYIAGNMRTTVYGATVVGTTTGIEQRAGSITIGNSRIEGGMDEPTMNANGNGSTADNVAVAIAQHTTKKPIDVYIYNGATLIGGASFMEGNPQNNPDATKDTTINIKTGTFVGPVKTLSDTDCTHFLYGGHYTEEPEAKYVANNCEVVPADTYKPSFDIVAKN